MPTLTENPAESLGTSKYTVDGREYTRVFNVLLDSQPTYSAREVLQVAGLPDIGDAHPQDAYAYCESLDPEPTSNRLMWRVKAIYKTPKAGEDGGAGADPFEDPWKIRYSFESIERPVDKDINGESVNNSVNLPFDPPLTELSYYLTLSVTRNTLLYYPTTAVQYLNCVNVADTNILGTIYAPRTALLRKWDAENLIRNGIEYWQEQIEMVFAWDTWDRYVLDTSLYELKSGKLVRIMIGDQDATEPVRINSLGQALLTAGATSHYIHFESKQKRNFNILGLAR